MFWALVVPAHLPDRPKLVVLDSFYTTDLFGQTDASPVRQFVAGGGAQRCSPCRDVGTKASPSAVPLLLAVHCFL